MRKLALLCCTVLALAGCTMQAYEGPELPDEETAALAPWYDPVPELLVPGWKVKQVDGVAVKHWENHRLYLLPGPHEVDARRWWMGIWEDDCASWVFEAEAGVEYRMDERAPDTLSIAEMDPWKLWWDDGEEVARSPIVPCTAS